MEGLAYRVDKAEHMAVHIVVADDHEVVRLGMRSILANTDIVIVAEAESGDEAIRLVGKHNPDALLLDVRMPGGDGMRTLSRLQLDRPNLPVLMYSGYDNPSYIARSVALGASGFILKGAPLELLLESIRKVAAGERLWTREQLRSVSSALSGPNQNIELDISLTRREVQVLRQMTFGQSNKEIASQLSISYETVKEHVAHILTKVGVTGRTQAAVWAIRNGLFD